VLASTEVVCFEVSMVDIADRLIVVPDRVVVVLTELALRARALVRRPYSL
jgi:hypothetical protein